jgi:hypothetical protein
MGFSPLLKSGKGQLQGLGMLRTAGASEPVVTYIMEPPGGQQDLSPELSAHRKPNQSGFCPHVDLIYGIKMDGRTKLFSAVGPVVNEKDEYYSAGQGYYMADFLARRMFGDHLTIHQCVIVAAYTLFQAKEHVDGCGGDSHIAVLRDTGPSGLLNFQVINSNYEELGNGRHRHR